MGSILNCDLAAKIARWRQADVSVEVIAEKLGRHRSSIFRELRRNAFEDREMPELIGYYCVTAHNKAQERRKTISQAGAVSAPAIGDHGKQLGHWECDLIQFRKKFGKANVTSLVERVSRASRCSGK